MSYAALAAEIEDALATERPEIRISQLLDHQAVAAGIVALWLARMAKLPDAGTHQQRIGLLQTVLAECLETWSTTGTEIAMSEFLSRHPRQHVELWRGGAGVECRICEGAEVFAFGDGTTFGAALRAACVNFEAEMDQAV